MIEDILCRRTNNYKYINYVENWNNIEQLTLDHFHKNYINLIYPAKSYYSAIMYAKFISILTNINIMDILNRTDIMTDDLYFTPLCCKIQNYTPKRDISMYLLAYSYDKLIMGNNIYKYLFNNLVEDDYKLNKGTNRATFIYFIKEFNLTLSQIKIILKHLK